VCTSKPGNSILFLPLERGFHQPSIESNAVLELENLKKVVALIPLIGDNSHMNKWTPHYTLSEIQAQMVTVDSMYLTKVARIGIRDAGLTQADALAVIASLGSVNFYKSMTTYADANVWQDVYHGKHGEINLYVKFQLAKNYFVISFKEK
jgi:motility quorum-sensing regulator / GCU-specific mRNA interferase toxin